MRLKNYRGLRGIELWIWVAVVLCAFAPETVASGLISTMPSLWATATALSLMLITVVSANQKWAPTTAPGVAGPPPQEAASAFLEFLNVAPS